MATYGEQIVDILRADITLMALLTGGVYLFEDGGPKGINRIQMKNAFNTQTGLIKPMAVVNEIQEEPTGEAVDVPSNFMSTASPIFIYIYDAGQVGYARIAQADALIFTLLNNTRLTDGFQLIYKTTLKNRQEPNLNDARYWASQYMAHGYRS